MLYILYIYIYIYIYMYISYRSKMIIMKTKYPPGYHHNGSVETPGLGLIMYGLCHVSNRTSCAQVYELPQTHCCESTLFS